MILALLLFPQHFPFVQPLSDRKFAHTLWIYTPRTTLGGWRVPHAAPVNLHVDLAQVLASGLFRDPLIRSKRVAV